MTITAVSQNSEKKLSVFRNARFGEVRTVTIGGEPWFVGKDVADCLGYINTKDAIISHVDAEDRQIFQRSENATFEISNRGITIINESGLYSLIMSSKLPSAKEFKRWVTSEVLPSIRKHGIYATDNVIDRILNNPDFGIELLKQLKDERAKRIEAEKTNSALMHSYKTYTVTEIAKEMGLRSAVELNAILERNNFTNKNLCKSRVRSNEMNMMDLSLSKSAEKREMERAKNAKNAGKRFKVYNCLHGMRHLQFENGFDRREDAVRWIYNEAVELYEKAEFYFKRFGVRASWDPVDLQEAVERSFNFFVIRSR